MKSRLGRVVEVNKGGSFHHEDTVSETRLIERRAWDFSGGFVLKFFAELGDDGFGFGVGFDREVIELHRVGSVIVEFDSFLAFVPFAIAPALGFDAAAHDGIFETFVGGAKDLRDGRAVPFGDGV